MDEYKLASEEAFADREPAQLCALGPVLLSEFAQAKLDRQEVEERWLKDLRQYKGMYDPEVLASLDPQQSRAFVRKTRVKVKTLNSRVTELLFPSGTDKNWNIEPTPIPSLTPEQKKKIVATLNQMQQAVMQQQMMMAQEQGIEPGQIQPPELDRQTVEAAVLDVAKEAARKMEQRIEDQLTESRYKEVSIRAIHSCHLYGTGIVKGPLVERKYRTSFKYEDGKWVEKSEAYVSPFVDFVPLWRFYPDMASSEIAVCRYAYELHRMTQSDLAELSERKSFAGTRIKDYIRSNPNGRVESIYIDTELKNIGSRMSRAGDPAGMYDVLERWGWLTGEQLAAAGVEVEEDRKHEAFFTNVWVLPDGQVIKTAIRPINGVTWPYHFYYFDKDETSIFGEGLGAIMRDDQTMINAATRMILDNAALTAGPMMEVNVGLLAKLEDATKLGPRKVWLRNSQNPGQRAVVPVELPSRLGELNSIVQMFDANADEVSAVPRYMSGENVGGGAAGTASGMSMLMGAVNIVIKDLVTAWEEGVMQPFLTAMYRWNMQFNPDPEIKGDYNVKARGSSSLVAKEIRTRQLNEFAVATSNPMDAPFVKREKLLRYRAEANELADVVKTEEEVKAEQGGQQDQVMQAQLQELKLKLERMALENEAIKAKSDLALAQIELTKAKTVDTRVESVYAAIQAGGAAAANPMIAPAGDEILQSTGFVDATPDPALSQLMGSQVQGQPIEMTGGVNPDTGMEGARAGIETVAND